MRTSKPVSTISYNSESFLRNLIESWKECGWIEFGMWIRHEPEADEKKAHFHVYLKPAKLIQTTDFEFYSQEIDPEQPDKPLKMISFRTSKESDWVLYGLHDEAYLSAKGMEREKHYDISDIQSTCDDTLKEILSHVSDERKGQLEFRIIDCVSKGMSWVEIVRSGLIPIRQIAGAKMYYTAITGQENFIQ